jgi:hypothetical protein
MDAEAYYGLLRNGTPEERRALLASLPDTGFTDSVTGLVGSDQPGMVIIAFLPAVMSLSRGVDPGMGAPLAFALHKYAVEVFEQNDDHAGLLPTTLSNSALQYVNACNLLGNSEAVLDFTDKWIPYYEQLAERENLPALKTARINALLNVQRLDDAQKALEDPTLRGNFASDIEVSRLEQLLAQLRGNITKDRRAANAATQANAATAPVVSDEIRNGLMEFVRQAIDDPEEKERMTAALSEVLSDAKPSDYSSPSGFGRLLDGLAKVETFMTRGQGTDNELTIRRRIREASGIFVTGQPGPELLRKSLAELTECLAWTQAHQHLQLMNDALWSSYLCHNRLQQPSEAADAVLALRANLEKDRASIADPLQRGGVFSRYPYLFAALCDQLQKAGRTGELLEAIEASKGRGVADILTRKSGRSVTDEAINSAALRLPALTREHRFHYLTYVVDEDQTFAAFVSKDGDVHAVPPIPLGQAPIRDAAAVADPRVGGSTAEVLAPLVACIGELMNEGVIEVGDHVCYAADEDLANVPLQYLPVGERPLIDYVSLSRIHSAFHLEHVLAVREAPPTRYHGIVAPTRQNTERASWPELQRYLRQPIDWLAAHLEGEVAENDSASLEHITTSDLRGRVLHFSAHGLFPHDGTGGTPFEHSGIILGSSGSLADEERLRTGDFAGVLTPMHVLDAGLDLAKSHVSLMSCVSGLSREGLGGDALGIEWALLQAGSASLMASHWNVSAPLAAAFFERFYEHWVAGGRSRADALRQTVAEFRAMSAPYSRPECWAAFSLTGDWR